MKPSQIKTYVERWSEDPAFVQGDSEEHAIKLTNAIDTGDWSALRVDGGPEPVTYNVRPIGPGALAVLIDMQTDGSGNNELCTLAFRAALVSVAGLGGVKVAFEDHRQFGRISTLSWLEDAKVPPVRAVRLLHEIGSRVLNRAMDLDPK